MVKGDEIKGEVCKGQPKRQQRSLISSTPGHIVTEPTTQEQGCRKPIKCTAGILLVHRSVGAKYHSLLILP